ncbi:MAG: hypothetical protein BWY63_01039 [Chloroflexi bacterium ADurb.Bin360]|nr:MAG: hypothetical protein BWY63_01039 [Chloroflexi bacterium ADurb.Bin360]
MPQYRHCFLVESPGHSITRHGVQATVRRQQTESDPAFVQRRRGQALEAADIMAPEAETGKPEGKPATQTLCHRLKT